MGKHNKTGMGASPTVAHEPGHMLPSAPIDHALKTVLLQKGFCPGAPIAAPAKYDDALFALETAPLSLNFFYGYVMAPFALPIENSAGVRTSTKSAPLLIASSSPLLSVLANMLLNIPNMITSI